MHTAVPRHALVLAASVAVVIACDKPVEPPPAEEPPGTVLAAYVLFAPAATAGGSAQTVARAIVDGAGADCSALDSGGSNYKSRANPDETRFPVTVCEAVVPAGPASSVGGKSLPAVSHNPQTLVIFGDTGCHHGDCSGAATPFETLAGAAAGKSPELVLHVGDYNYRGTSSHVPLKSDPNKTLSVYDAGDDASSDSDCQLTSPYVSQNAGYSANPDIWENWWLDFFEPGASLFATAPFVFARGNHELCSRAGPGFFYFLDPSGPATGTPQLSCPDQGGGTPPSPPADAEGHYVIRAPYTVELTTLNVAVLDSANACDGFAPFSDCGSDPTSPVCTSAKQLSTLFGATPAGKRTWLLSHRPFWGAEAPDNGDCSDSSWSTINSTLQQALSQAGSFPASLELAVAGHMHRFQTLTFTGSQALPPQLVIGDSGVELDDFDPSPCSFNTTVGGQPATGVELNQFGFLHVTGLGGSGWKGELIGQSGNLACCDSTNPQGSVCSLGACS